MCMCNKCKKMSGWLVLIVGVLFLLRDTGVWGFWGIQWWTAAFLLFGLAHIGMAGCAGCQACCGSCDAPAKPAKKK